MTSTVTVLLGDVRDRMADLPDAHVDLVVTSPPFLALRSYLPADHPDKHREIGSEATPAAFLSTMMALTADWGRLVPEWGSVCVELGDTMAGSGGAGGDYNPGGIREGQDRFGGTAYTARQDTKYPKVQRSDHAGGITNLHGKVQGGGAGWPLAKSMCLIPHLYTASLAYGRNLLTGEASPAGQWRIRNVICWARPNPPVGSLGKRNPDKRTGDAKFRPATSYITVACRGTGRFFDLDAVRTAPSANTHTRIAKGRDERFDLPSQQRDGNWNTLAATNDVNPAGAPPLDWHADDLDGDWLWKLATQPYKGSHYATFPVTLPRRLIAAMCPERVCDVCGWPSERITRHTAMLDGKPLSVAVDASSRDVGAAHGFDHNRLTTERTTLGFTDCGHDAWRPGRVLDPFGGSGTTAVAAAVAGRDAVLIDLDERNLDLIRRRLTEAIPGDPTTALVILDEERDGDVVTFTVDVRSSTEAVQIAAGQLGLLFDEAS